MHFVYNTEKIDQLKYYSSLEYWRDDFVLYPSLHWFFRNNVRYALKYQPDRQILVLASMVTSPKLAYHSDFQGLESKWANTLIIEWSTLEGPSLHWWPMALSRCHFGLCKLWVVCVHHTRQPPDHEELEAVRTPALNIFDDRSLDKQLQSPSQMEFDHWEQNLFLSLLVSLRYFAPCSVFLSCNNNKQKLDYETSQCLYGPSLNFLAYIRAQWRLGNIVPNGGLELLLGISLAF